MHLEDLLSAHPGVRTVEAAEVETRVRESGRVLIVLDDDPTGTQAVAGLPVLASWGVDDLLWALDTGASAIYVLTNTRSFDAETAERINREVVAAAVAAAEARGAEIGFVSRSDSTLRGHFPLEPDTIADALAQAGKPRPHGVIVVPAFPEAHRVTVAGVHYTRERSVWKPVGESEFARDATFGYSSSRLSEWVAEKSGGTIPAECVVELRLTTIRAGAEAIAAVLRQAPHGSVVVADTVVEDDMRLLALGLDLVEAEGRSYVYRVGPPFVRARIGQVQSEPLSVFPRENPAGAGGLIIVGSHTSLTTRQLESLWSTHPEAEVVELHVGELVAPADAERAIARAIEASASGLSRGNVILQTSRMLVRSADPAESLAFSRTVSDALVAVTRGVVGRVRPSFVIAKGGITSSDIATRGLEITRAEVEGSVFPGLVSVWRAVNGPAEGIPFIVFPGNVGSESSLADAVTKFTG